MSDPKSGDLYAEETVLLLGEVTSPDEQPTKVVSVVVDGVAGMQRDDVVKVLHPDREYPPPYTFDRHYSYMSWGAEGATEAILLWFSGAISQEVLTRGLDYLIEKYAHPSTADIAPRLDAARAAAYQTVARLRPNLTPEDIVLTKTTEDSSGFFEFRFEAGGEVFEARVERRRHLAYVTHLRRTIALGS